MFRLPTETWFTIFVTLALLFVAVNIQAGWLFILVFSILSILLFSILMGRWWISGEIRVERFTAPVFEGETLDVLVRITNLSPRNKYLLVLEDRIPSKNFAKSVFLFFPFVPKGKTIERRYQIIAEHRGVDTVDFLTLSSGGPSGLFRCRRRVDCKSVTTVYPISRNFSLPDGERVGAAVPSDQGIQVGKGGDDEFFGIRAYEPGDSTRSVHWGSSAKAGKLMVKEMNRAYAAFVSFYLDGDRSLQGEPFEEMVRLATYGIEKTAKEGNLVRLFRDGEMLQRDWWGNLEALASFKPEAFQSLPEQIESNLPLLLAERQLFIFTALPREFDPDKWGVLRAFQESSVRIHIVFFAPTGYPDNITGWLQAQGISFSFVEVS